MSYTHSQLNLRVRENLPITWRSQLISGVTSGSNVFVPLEGVQASGQFALIGFTGTSSNELQSVSGGFCSSGFTVSSLQDSYERGTTVALTNFNQVKLMSATTATGTYSAVTSGSGTITGLNNPDGVVLKNVTIDPTKYYKVLYGTGWVFQDSGDVEPFQMNSLGESIDGYCTVEDVEAEAGFYDESFSIPPRLILQDIRAGKDLIDAAVRTQTTQLPLSDPPHYLKLANRLYAAGHLLLREYGIVQDSSSKDGRVKIDGANMIIKDIRDGVIDVTNNAGDESSSGGNIRFHPSTEDSRMFSVDMDL